MYQKVHSYLEDGGGRWYERVLMVNHASHMLEC